MSASGEVLDGAAVPEVRGTPAPRARWLRRESVGTITVSRLGAPLLQARDACTFATRLRGLHGMLPLGPTDALVIRPCRAIQTYRMPCTIDVVFLDRQGTVLRIESVPPGRMRMCAGARIVIETAAGTAARLSLAPGHVLSSSTGKWT